MTQSSLPPSEVPMLPARTLLGPGPSDVNPRVLKVMTQGMIGYLDPDFTKIMDEVTDLIRRVYQTKDGRTMALSGTGMAGMEAGFASLVEPGDTVIMCIYGYFCERMVEIGTRVQANVVPLRADWGAPFPAELLEQELKKHKNVKMVSAVHAETSTGVRQPLQDLSRLTREHDALFMVDAVTSLGGVEVAFDDWGMDYAYAATQKCLGCPPGLSPVSLSERALHVAQNRKSKPFTWYLDLGMLANYWGWGEKRVYHHTAPVSMILALREGLRLVLEEGLENRFKRHVRNAAALAAGLRALGLKLVVPDEYRLSQITLVWIPDGIDDAEVRGRLLRSHGIEIGAGLGDFAGRVWRIGLMGESSKQENIITLLSALEKILPEVGYEVAVGSGVKAAEDALASS
jgi:alanine-glyoxylate transaminase/serine-glyoxylate transaminase/serine-pyruvate transaminase